jgi:FkbM family methyltransferase
LQLDKRLRFIFPSDGFGALEENLLTGSNIIKEKRLEIIALKKAVWSYKGVLKFVDVGWSEGGYVTPSQHIRSKAYVEAITLDEILDLSKGKTLIKMDIEGAEVKVLNSSKLDRVSALAIEAHGNEHALIKILNKRGFNTKLVRYKLNPQLFRYWLRIKPKPYGILIALYRFLISTTVIPTITVVKAINTKQSYVRKAT